MHHISKLISIICMMTFILAIPACAWTAGIDIATGQATYDLQYGIEPNSTAECDNGIDEIVPPPAPGMKKAAYFTTTGTFQELSTDIRPEVGWQLYLMSDENISITWDQPPASLSLTIVSTGQTDPAAQDVPDMSSETSLTLDPGTYMATISAVATDSGGDSSGDSDNSDAFVYQPPQVVTAATPVPTGTLAQPKSTPKVTDQLTPQGDKDTTPGDISGSDVAAGPTVMIPIMPTNTTATPTQSPIQTIVPFIGLGAALISYMRINRFK